MRAWNNDPKIRQAALDALTKARERDMLIHGTYFCEELSCNEPAGCAVGTIHMATRDFKEGELLGAGTTRETAWLVDLPYWVMTLIECFFESESNPYRPDNQRKAVALRAPERVVRAIPVGLELPDKAPTAIFGGEDKATRWWDDFRSDNGYRTATLERFEAWIDSLIRDNKKDEEPPRLEKTNQEVPSASVA